MTRASKRKGQEASPEVVPREIAAPRVLRIQSHAAGSAAQDRGSRAAGVGHLHRSRHRAVVQRPAEDRGLGPKHAWHRVVSVAKRRGRPRPGLWVPRHTRPGHGEPPGCELLAVRLRPRPRRGLCGGRRATNEPLLRRSSVGWDGGDRAWAHLPAACCSSCPRWGSC